VLVPTLREGELRVRAPSLAPCLRIRGKGCRAGRVGARPAGGSRGGPDGPHGPVSAPSWRSWRRSWRDVHRSRDVVEKLATSSAEPPTASPSEGRSDTSAHCRRPSRAVSRRTRALGLDLTLELPRMAGIHWHMVLHSARWRPEADRPSAASSCAPRSRMAAWERVAAEHVRSIARSPSVPPGTLSCGSPCRPALFRLEARHRPRLSPARSAGLHHGVAATAPPTSSWSSTGTTLKELGRGVGLSDIPGGPSRRPHVRRSALPTSSASSIATSSRENDLTRVRRLLREARRLRMQNRSHSLERALSSPLAG